MLNQALLAVLGTTEGDGAARAAASKRPRLMAPSDNMASQPSPGQGAPELGGSQHGGPGSGPPPRAGAAGGARGQAAGGAALVHRPSTFGSSGQLAVRGALSELRLVTRDETGENHQPNPIEQLRLDFTKQADTAFKQGIELKEAHKQLSAANARADCANDCIQELKRKLSEQAHTIGTLKTTVDKLSSSESALKRTLDTSFTACREAEQHARDSASEMRQGKIAHCAALMRIVQETKEARAQAREQVQELELELESKQEQGPGQDLQHRSQVQKEHQQHARLPSKVTEPELSSEPDGQQKDLLSELERLHSWHALFIETTKSCPRCWEQILQASNNDQDKGED
jgi:hypothetical protein